MNWKCHSFNGKLSIGLSKMFRPSCPEYCISDLGFDIYSTIQYEELLVNGKQEPYWVYFSMKTLMISIELLDFFQFILPEQPIDRIVESVE